jgi:hypothetical protein
MSSAFEIPQTLPRPPFYRGLNRAQIAAAEAHQFRAMLHRLRWLIPQLALRLGDRAGRAWLRDNLTPYQNEIMEMAVLLGTGIYSLNTGYEWCCTAFVRPDENGIPIMHRVLDWTPCMAPFMHVAEYETPHGRYQDINWAGNAGIINGIAPGRFVIAINQAPIPMHLNIGGAGLIGDWLIQRRKTFTGHNLPPTHLLRHVFETAPDYPTACDMLIRTPLATPVIFTICGTQPNEAIVIERTENAAHIISDKVCTANHWQNPAWRGHPRPIRSRARLAAAKNYSTQISGSNWNWLKRPILNKHSIMAFQARASGQTECMIITHENSQSKPYLYLSF